MNEQDKKAAEAKEKADARHDELMKAEAERQEILTKAFPNGGRARRATEAVMALDDKERKAVMAALEKTDALD